jgi:hypothetical protein
MEVIGAVSTGSHDVTLRVDPIRNCTPRQRSGYIDIR